LNWFFDLLHNHVLLNALAAWVVAQIVKVLVHTAVNRKFDVSRLFGDGGMPSGHAATVTAMAATCAIEYGFGSFAFALSTVLALIVMHDAAGVRLETGKQSQVLNQIMDFFRSMDSGPSFENTLKELVGHTPLQVVMGSLLGLLIALILG
jgi:acid phosphatase family membrane protein YuiD